MVPARAAETGPVLVAYDGSAPAMRALQSFALLELAEASPVKLLALGPEAARLAAEGRGEAAPPARTPARATAGTR